jgi:hypothetical protein
LAFKAVAMWGRLRSKKLTGRKFYSTLAGAVSHHEWKKKIRKHQCVFPVYLSEIVNCFLIQRKQAMLGCGLRFSKQEGFPLGMCGLLCWQGQRKEFGFPSTQGNPERAACTQHIAAVSPDSPTPARSLTSKKVKNMDSKSLGSYFGRT